MKTTVPSSFFLLLIAVFFLHQIAITPIYAAPDRCINDKTTSILSTTLRLFQTRMQDSLALVELYNATDGANWGNVWDLNTPINQWTGVTYNNGVTGLNLTNRGLVGTLPNLNLPNLSSIILNLNQLSGVIPSFSNCPNLLDIQLSDNQLNGTIPNFNQANLRTLRLNNNQLEGTIPNFNLPNLLGLELKNNKLTGQIPSFSNMGSISTIDLSRNDLSGFIPDFNHFALTNIVLNSNDLTGTIPSFLNLSNLRELSIYSNQLEGTIPDYAHLTQLEKLFIGNRNLEGTIPNFALPMLQQLFLSNSINITGPVPNFNFLPNLTHLWLSSCPNLDGLPTFSLPNLQYLDVGSSAFSFDDMLPNINATTGTYRTGNQHLYCLTDPVIVTKNIGELLMIDLEVDAAISDNEYQWYKDGATHGSPTNQNTLTINALTAADAGTYYCKITNPAISGTTVTSCDYKVVLPCTVATNDSLALIQFYTDLGGPNWTTTWDLMMPISTWHGITLDQCKITDIRISDNNLTGTIPNITLPDVSFIIIDDNNITGALPSFSNAPNLLVFEAIGNKISAIPNLTGHPTLALVLMSDNALTFEDIIPNKALMEQNPPFPGYSMQKPLTTPAGATLQAGDNHTITIPSFDAGITSNVYEWFKGSTSLGAGNGQSLTLTNVSLSDAGDYTLKVTNPTAPDLTLASTTITISVMPMSGSGICDQDDLTIPTISQSIYHAKQTLASTAIVSSATTFKAGISITLQPGFHAINSTDFLATIESCANPLNSETPPISTKQAINTTLYDAINQMTVFPSPFSATTTIAYTLDRPGLVRIALYDISGQQLQVLENTNREKGVYQVRLDGEFLGSGLYLLKAVLGILNWWRRCIW